MLEGNEDHLAAEAFEDAPMLHALAFFGECDQVDLVIFGELTQQMKHPLIGAAIDRVGDVRVDNQDVHEQYELHVTKLKS